MSSSLRLLASGIPVASQVRIPVLLHESELEHLHRGDVGVEQRVDVPSLEEAVGVGVEEDDYGREIVVVIDDVC